MNDNTEILKELMDVKAECNALKTERAEILEQINNLGKYIGRPGMTVAHIVSETVSKIEKLEVKVNYAQITDHERRVIDRLAVAWNDFNALQPVEDEAKAEFRHAINSAASIIALRVARRVNPECWTPSNADAGDHGQNANSPCVDEKGTK